MNMKPKSCKMAIFTYFLKRQCIHSICKFDLNASSKAESINKKYAFYIKLQYSQETEEDDL